MYRPLTPDDFPNFHNSKNKKAPLPRGEKGIQKAESLLLQQHLLAVHDVETTCGFLHATAREVVNLTMDCGL